MDVEGGVVNADHGDLGVAAVSGECSIGRGEDEICLRIRPYREVFPAIATPDGGPA